MRGLLLLTLLLAGPAMAQPYGPGPCPVGASSCQVKATGGSVTSTLADWFQGVTKSAANWTFGGTVTSTGVLTAGAVGANGIDVNIASVANTNANIALSHSGQLRWQLALRNDTESGHNTGGPLGVLAYADAGVSQFKGFLWEGSRSSGGDGAGKPYFDKFSPYTLTNARAAPPNGTYGNFVLMDGVSGDAGDTQPTTTLSATPIAASLGSAVVQVTMANCCASGGPLDLTGGQAWVKLSNVTLFGGLTGLNGWLKVGTDIDANHFTVSSLTTASCDPTCTGGGSTVTVQPSAPMSLDKWFTEATTGAAGFVIQNEKTFAVNPSFFQQGVSPAPNYQQYYSQFYTAPDASAVGTNSYTHVGWEWDMINRGPDIGYQPLFFNGPEETVGMYLDPYSFIQSNIPGTGTAHNWQTMIALAPGNTAVGSSTASRVGAYQGIMVMPDFLVGKGFDPGNTVTASGHGGVGYEAFGSFFDMGANPFATSNGTKTITATVQGRQLIGAASGDTVTFPSTYSVAGVTFGGPTNHYAITCTTSPCWSGTTFTFTGGGSNASSSTTGGGSNQAGFLTQNVPYSPMQVRGEWQYGIRVHSQTLLDDGLIVHSTPGNGIGWDDATGIASVTGTQVSAGNVSVDITPSGTAPINAKGPLVLQTYTVATLPSCAAAIKGAMTYVTDAAAAPVYNATVAGGGAVIIPVFCNGTNWTNH